MIGKGAFASIHRARHSITGDTVAIKCIDLQRLSAEDRAHIAAEVRVMKLIQHGHVVRLYQVLETSSKMYLVLEYGEGGDLASYIHDCGRLHDGVVRDLFSQVVEAVRFCHERHVAHRDIKAENIIFTDAGAEIVKLSDFGLSNTFRDGVNLETPCGSMAYSAPELLLCEPYGGPAVDVWALGCCLYLMAVGSLPFAGANDATVVTQIMDVKYPPPPTSVAPGCAELISRMLTKDPERRPTCAEILQHPWLRGDRRSTPSPVPFDPHSSVASSNYSADGDGVPRRKPTRHSTAFAQPQRGRLGGKLKALGHTVMHAIPSAISAIPVGRRRRSTATAVPRRMSAIAPRDRDRIVGCMAESGHFGDRDEILSVLADNGFNYTTGTFFLLLEQRARVRRGSSQRIMPNSAEAEAAARPSIGTLSVVNDEPQAETLANPVTPTEDRKARKRKEKQLRLRSRSDVAAAAETKRKWHRFWRMFRRRRRSTQVTPVEVQ